MLLLRGVQECLDKIDIYVVIAGEAVIQEGLLMTEQLRNVLPEWVIEADLSGSSLKSQFKRADKSGAKWALVIGEEEIKTNTVTLKHLRETVPQKSLTRDTLIPYLKSEG